MTHSERLRSVRNTNPRNRCLLVVGLLLLALLWSLGPQAAPAWGQTDPLPLKDLFPAPADQAAPLPPWLVRDWDQVPEIALHAPGGRFLIGDFVARINKVNERGADQFLKTILEQRSDLVGLPVLLGDSCLQTQEQRQTFFREVSVLRILMLRVQGAKFWQKYALAQDSRPKANPQVQDWARVAALMQVLPGEELEMREGLVKYLADVEHAETTRALARLALFSFEESLRKAARNALRSRPRSDSADLLLAGLRYPWPAVARNAAEVLVSLEQKALVPELVSFLDAPDPRAPAPGEFNGKQTLLVRELVRLNHHRNCLLCHPPVGKLGLEGNQTADVATGPIPIPGRPFPLRAPYYQALPTVLAGLGVRADVTYLRQDFSLLQRVKDAAPWPEMQRFDYLLRTRPATEKEAAQYREWQQQPGSRPLSPNHREALAALRALTGRDAPEPTAASWRQTLGLARR